MKVTIEPGKCVSAGLCVQTAPDVFDQREDDGVVILLTEHPPGDLSTDIKDAVLLCPAGAIQLDT
ncbi:ferredoxin [Streptomyces sp. NPDC020965]|uniref:ferredoxin n=1 Tax=Streptomyces sp. NPDC020965 TaxID=3365105 RepID=UPI0037BB2963